MRNIVLVIQLKVLLSPLFNIMALVLKQNYICFTPGAVVQYTHFFHMLQPLKLNTKKSEYWKNESLVGSTPGAHTNMHFSAAGCNKMSKSSSVSI